MEEKHPIEGIMYSALQGLRDMIDVNTIVGDPVSTADGTVIIPISKVSMGFGVGGSEFEARKKTDSSAPRDMFGGGTAGGVSLTPVAFLVVGNGQMRMMPVTPENSVYDRLLDMAPGAIDKIVNLFSVDKKNKKTDIHVETVMEEEDTE